MQRLERKDDEFRRELIDTLTRSFKNASGYATLEHGVDKWKETVTLLIDGILELTKDKRDG